MVSPWNEKVPDWDVPSEDNDAVCARFLKKEYKRGGITLPYRLFVPEGDFTAKLPLTLFLHGADVTGTDNEVHIRAHDIGAVYAREEWQSLQPQFLVAPQYHGRVHWSREDVMAMLMDIIEELCQQYPIIDRDRLYVYGYSAGGIGALRFLKKHPGYFARAILMCAATANDTMEELSRTPMWLFHAADDDIVSNRENPTLRDGSYLGSGEIYRVLKERMGDNLRYTEYAPGEMKRLYRVNPHCAWVPVARDEAALRWLIEK